MLTKNQIYEACVTDYTSEGQGVAHIDGCAVFIPNAIAGEVYKVRIEVAKKNWAAGKIVEILEKSPHRCNRECPVAKLCGGCDFWHMDYEEESRLKAERVKNCLNRLGGENLEKAFRLAKDYIDTHNLPAPLVTINSWNEWTESSYLQPDDLYGYGYLEAVQDVFCK